jgi:hypothetical protein
MTNKLLQEFRIEMDSSDPWGSSLMWHFAVADMLTVLSGTTPAEWDFHQSPLGADTLCGEYATLTDLLGDSSLKESILLLEKTGTVLGRYSNICRLAGLDY